MANSHYTFHSEQIVSHYNQKRNGKPSGQTRRNVVDIKNNVGTKSVNVYDASGKQMQTNSKQLNAGEIIKIKANVFIPGLFKDCQGNSCKKAIQNSPKSRKNRKTRKQRK